MSSNMMPIGNPYFDFSIRWPGPVSRHDLWEHPTARYTRLFYDPAEFPDLTRSEIDRIWNMPRPQSQKGLAPWQIFELYYTDFDGKEGYEAAFHAEYERERAYEQWVTESTVRCKQDFRADDLVARNGFLDEVSSRDLLEVEGKKYRLILMKRQVQTIQASIIAAMSKYAGNDSEAWNMVSANQQACEHGEEARTMGTPMAATAAEKATVNEAKRAEFKQKIQAKAAAPRLNPSAPSYEPSPSQARTRRQSEKAAERSYSQQAQRISFEHAAAMWESVRRLAGKQPNHSKRRSWESSGSEAVSTGWSQPPATPTPEISPESSPPRSQSSGSGLPDSLPVRFQEDHKIWGTVPPKEVWYLLA